MGASGGYGYYFIVLEDDADEDDTDDNPMSSSPPIARINPSNPKIQANETILFSASDSTDSDGDTLTFTWIFEGDSEQKKEKMMQLINDDPFGIPGHQHIIQDMVSAIHENRDPIVTGIQGRNALRVITACQLSAERKEPVHMGELIGGKNSE